VQSDARGNLVQARFLVVDRPVRSDARGNLETAKFLEEDSKSVALRRLVDNKSAVSVHQVPAKYLAADHREQSDAPDDLETAKYLEASHLADSKSVA
jgi:hypothetical protein